VSDQHWWPGDRLKDAYLTFACHELKGEFAGCRFDRICRSLNDAIRIDADVAAGIIHQWGNKTCEQQWAKFAKWKKWAKRNE
jgi:hypothetical protein